MMNGLIINSLIMTTA
ncbi:putative membrane protein, partial [Yersinia pestis PY-15]